MVFVVALVTGMLGLGYATKHILMSTAYAVWTGISAAVLIVSVIGLFCPCLSGGGLWLVKAPAAAAERSTDEQDANSKD